MFDELSDITLIETPLMDSAGFLELLLRFCFNYWWYPALFICFITLRANGVIITSPLR